MSLLVARELTVQVPGRREPVLAGVSLALESGQTVAVVGATGSGKSVLVRALCGLEALQGEVEVAGVSSLREGWEAVRTHLGVLLSLPGLIDDISLFDNVAYGPRRRGQAEAAVRDAVMGILDEYGLADAAAKLPAQLSGGMRRRGALARALVHRPACLLLDDPTAGLDPITTRAVMAFIAGAAAKRGAAVLLTTHDLERVAATASTVWLLSAGRLRSLEGTPAQWAAELGA